VAEAHIHGPSSGSGRQRLPEILSHLERLVAFDTQNPPRHIGAGGIFPWIVDVLGPAFTCTVTDLGDGCVSLLAVRGHPRLLFNVHLDTVPVGEGWVTDPFLVTLTGDRAIGRGTADTKGAAACLLSAAAHSGGDTAFLFTSDEEAGSSRCVRDFLAKLPPFGAVQRFEGAVVSEPTRCRAVLEHRGIATASGRFEGVAGHGSSESALADSALHEAVRWAARALTFAEAQSTRRYKTLSGIRFNVGVLQGGTKVNMVAASADLRFGVRPLPDQDPDQLLAAVQALAPRPERARWERGFVAPPLPGPGGIALSTRLAERLGLSVGPPVDFWTEAALFSAAALPAIVYGPGDISQAHTAGEWVPLSDLLEAYATYARILSEGGSP
jgi:acetylornithine deacetylase